MSKKISELPDAGALTGGDELIPIVQDGDTVKTTVQDIADYAGSGATWGSITGTLSAQTDLNTALGDKVDKVTGKGLSANDFTSTLKTKLDGIEAGAQVNVNADWNATSGDAQILNKPTIPSAQVNSDWNATSGVAEILNKPTIPSAVTNTSDLTNDGADGVNPFITALDIPTAGQAGTLVREVKNMTGSTLTKGTVVYISGANGNKALVSKARANAESTSARTFGLLQSDILNTGTGYCVVIGDISGLDTSSFTEGAQLYLSGAVAGEYTSTKTLAPTHLVYVGKVTRSHPTQGQIEVQIQNGYELDEIHDCAISSVSDKQLLSYESSTSLWKNKSVTTADIADSTNKRYVTDANLTVIGNTSGTNTGDETSTSILSKLGWWQYNRITETASFSGTSEMILESILIPANTYLLGGILRLYNLKVRKVGGVGITTAMKIYIGPNSFNLTGATQIAIYSALAANFVTIEMLRTFTATTTALLGFGSGSSSAVDTGTGATARTSTTVDWTVNQYIMIAITAVSASDSYSMIGASAKNF